MPRWLVAVLAGCGCLVALFVGVIVVIVALGGLLLPFMEAPSIEVPLVEEFPEAEPFLSPEKNKEVERKPITIRVTGTSGVSFSGSYAAGGSSGSIEGVTPQDYQAEVRTGVDSISANVSKQDEENEELTLQVIVDGEVIREQSTTARFGVVWINLFPDEI